MFQITTLVCGFVLPILILGAYGSPVNGLVSSIGQFLALISFLELGVGSVLQSALYKPLAEKDDAEISRILKSGNSFFTKLAIILLGYVVVLSIVYPFFTMKEFDWIFTATLVLSMSISTFAQYFFGITDRLLLMADQKGYIQYISQIIALIINTLSCLIVIRLNGSIQIVKLTTSIVFLSRPLIVHFYVKKHYKIDKKIIVESEPIKQKWNGVAQHVAYVILDNTDIVVLTLLSTLSNVSIYSVYFLVVNGVKGLFLSCTTGIQSVMGELYAKNEEEKLKRVFGHVEFTIHTFTSLIFALTAVLIVPFISVYTSNITDANYYQPVFAYLLVGAHAFHCLRLPYNLMILAGGHYRQTQWCFIIAAAINIAISVACVFAFGLIGVAIGTLVSMAYQTIWMAFYNSKELARWPVWKFFKQLFIDLLIVTAIYLSTFWIKLNALSYFDWFIMALKVGSIGLGVTTIIACIFYFGEVKAIVLALKGILFRKKNSN